MGKKSSEFLINDPLYGFISTESDTIISLINHPYFQRLRRIKQLGLVEFVYPGATHTRFQHAIGSMHLSVRVVDVLRTKHIDISEEEKEALEMAVLLHDIGHGPFSHTLEKMFFNNTHEELSLAYMQFLNHVYNSKLQLAIDMFTNKYERTFFHQIINGQLDVDRLDYLKRDANHTGVAEGNIGINVIIKLLNVFDNQLVIEEKGIYPIENFLCARRMMSWQVYKHKTAVGSECLLNSILSRAKYLYLIGDEKAFSRISDSVLHFFSNKKIKIDIKDIIEKDKDVLFNYKNKKTDLGHFSTIDDIDIIASIKHWVSSEDYILSTLSKQFLQRNLFKCQIMSHKPEDSQIENIKDYICNEFKVNENEAHYFYDSGTLENHAYSTNDPFMVLTNGGLVKDVAIISDLPNIKNLNKVVKKHFLCWMKKV